MQGMLKQWICATTGKVLFTPKGRAYNRASPSLGSTANTALLSLIYGQMQSAKVAQAKKDRYTCFARSQVDMPFPTSISNFSSILASVPASCGNVSLSGCLHRCLHIMLLGIVKIVVHGCDLLRM